MRIDRALLRLFCLGVGFGVAAAAYAVEPKTKTSGARAVFVKARDAVLQVQVNVRGSDSDSASSTGTGFLVSNRGVLISNYHVVADYVLDPARYHLQYKTRDNRQGALELVAIDLANDLAVLKSDLTTVAPLALEATPPARGERGFSIGYPLNQGITVVEGTFNGVSEDFYRENFHFTGALNPGMSGGPVLSADGKVFGVNVAHQRGAQLVSFLVPARFAVDATQALRKDAVIPGGDWMNTAWRQVAQHSELLVRSLQEHVWESQPLGSFGVPAKQAAAMHCSQSVDLTREEKTEHQHLSCKLNAGVYVGNDIHTGYVEFSHTLVRNRKLNPLHFNRLLRNGFTRGSTASRPEKHYLPMRCLDRIVALRGVRAKALICAAAYRKHPELSDVMLRLLTLQGGSEELNSRLDMQGVAAADALAYIDRFMESIQWQAKPISK